MEYNRKGKTYELNEDILYHPVSQNSGLDTDTIKRLYADALDAGIPINTTSMERLYNAYHADRVDKFLEEYPIKGTIKRFPMTCQNETKRELENAFKESSKFHGRVPRIISSIARVYDLYKKLKVDITPAECVTRFHIQAVQNMIRAGIPECQAVVMYITYTPEQCICLADKPDVIDNVCTLLIKGYKSGEQSNIYAANWMVEHNQTNENMLKKITKDATVLNIEKDDTVEQVENKINQMKANSEVKKIEKAYKEPGFKLKDCTCELKGVEAVTEEGRYKAYIMNPTDPRQVYLGYDTHCCQKLGHAGESAMMHGLLNPKAGFWVIEERITGLIKAQAEIWEENENTLVFDNIELANDAELNLYKPILTAWLKDSEYTNVKMGTGYNELLRNGEEFRHCGAVTPTITPYEAYVLSYEDDSYCEGVAEEISSVRKAERLLEEGRITYYDYVYCDSENHAVWLKESGVLEPYFDEHNLRRTIEKAETEGFHTVAALLRTALNPVHEAETDISHGEEEYEEDEYNEDEEEYGDEDIVFE